MDTFIRNKWTTIEEQYIWQLNFDVWGYNLRFLCEYTNSTIADLKM